MVIWFTGISGTGKTTLGKKFLNFFKKKHPKSIYFDGDSFRSLFNNDLKYSLSDRNKNAFRLTRLTKYLNEQKYNIIITANLTSNKYRNWCRNNISEYFEIYIESKITDLVKRDKKNIYKKKLNVVGIDILFKKPKNSNFYITNNKGKKELFNNIKLIYKSLDKKNIF